MNDDGLYMASIYRLNGVNFWQSAKVLQEGLELSPDSQPEKVTALPFYFLASHAAELFLKSALLKRGLTEQELKQFELRHNLLGLLEELLAKGVSVTAGTQELVKGLSAQHASHALRYSALADNGQQSYLPPPRLLLELLEELLLLTRA